MPAATVGSSEDDFVEQAVHQPTAFRHGESRPGAKEIAVSKLIRESLSNDFFTL